MNKEKTSNRQEKQWYNAYIQPYNKIKGIKVVASNVRYCFYKYLSL